MIRWRKSERFTHRISFMHSYFSAINCSATKGYQFDFAQQQKEDNYYANMTKTNGWIREKGFKHNHNEQNDKNKQKKKLQNIFIGQGFKSLHTKLYLINILYSDIQMTDRRKRKQCVCIRIESQN